MIYDRMTGRRVENPPDGWQRQPRYVRIGPVQAASIEREPTDQAKSQRLYRISGFHPPK